MKHLFFSWAVLSFWEDWFDPIILLFANLLQGFSGKIGMMRRPFPCPLCRSAHTLCWLSPSQPRNKGPTASSAPHTLLRCPLAGCAGLHPRKLGKSLWDSQGSPGSTSWTGRGRREKMMIEGRAHQQEEGSVSFHLCVRTAEGENFVPTAFCVF